MTQRDTSRTIGNGRITSDERHIVESLKTILVPGQVTELRILDARTSSYKLAHVESGYFDDIPSMAKAASGIIEAMGFYFVPNVVNPELIARAKNRIGPARKNCTTSDSDIIRRRWLLVDLDPIRPTGISATDAEHEAALQRARDVFKYLRDLGWPNPIVADSGNGAHLLYFVDLPADDGGIIQRCLESLAGKFDDGIVYVDKTTYNPARIWKLYGTVACKGDDTTDRPHRLSRILSTPSAINPVPHELLERLAVPIVRTGVTTATSASNRNAFCLDTWIAKHKLDVRGPEDWRGGRRWIFAVCPWNANHTNASAFIVQLPGGAIEAGCHHNGCSANDWHSLRDVVEPDWRSSKGTSGTSVSPQQWDTHEWEEPKPLPAKLLPVKPFDLSLLPDALHDWIKDIAERVQCPVDYLAVTVMVALSSVVGRKLGIRPKRHDEWTVVVNLWGICIGRPGLMKTPAMQETLRPLKRLEIEAKARFDDALKEYVATCEVAKLKRAIREKEIKKALEDGKDAMAIARCRDDNDPPIRRRFIVNDPTVEKLGVILNQNPNGVLLYRDELMGFLRTLEKQGHEGARQFYLEAWSGDGRYTYDRIERGTLDIEAAIVSIIGSIQPGRLATYLHGVVQNKADNDGLIQRFQLAVWPDSLGPWRNVDRWPDTAAKNRAHEVFIRLANLEPNAVGAQRDEYEPNGIPFLRFDAAAQAAFDEWREKHEHRLRSAELHEVTEEHLAKYRKLVPALALLIHLADGGTGGVSYQAVNKAVGWAEYLESHAQRIYGSVLHPAVPAHALAERIRKGEVCDGFTIREVQRRSWSGLSSRDDVVNAVELLEELHWLCRWKVMTGGAPQTRYYLNPKIQRPLPDPLPKPTKVHSTPLLSVMTVTR